MRRTTLSLTLTAALTLGGCDFAPHYVRPALPVPPTLPAASPDPSAVDPADVAWRDFFTEPRLQKLIELALANNRDLRIAVANVAQSRAQFGERKAELFPTISASGSATFEKQSRGQLATQGVPTSGVSTPRRIDIYQGSIGISSWEIDLFGRLRNQSKEAFETYLASEEARNAAQVLLISEVATAYLTLGADQAGLAVATATVTSNRTMLDLARTRLKVGTASELDVRQAQTSYESALADSARRKTLVAQDLNALQLLVGAAPPAELLPNGLPENGATIPHLPVALPSMVLLRRPDIAEAEHKLRAANADIGAARAAFFPTISLTAALGTLSPALSGLFGSGNGNWSVEPQATLPIFDFGKNAANLRYSKASRDVAIAQYEKAIQTGFKEVADALAQRATIGDQLAAQTGLQEAAAASLRLSDLRYRTGVDPFLTVLDAQRTLYSAQQTLVTTRLTEQSNMVELYRSLGGGLR
ncbi:multidrug efflux system outer membrane protein [Sphingomonas vulcanisoli]|uniref:Multidrug efflux system outer membrane protein n=1 Tax=Sphingomonas vulcanisoli TaxID=1658060 RepID=A0ABX0TUS0_9SPHN|nr:efflux transporter outer membrane subunit [Sphingomonas vulcanisoli]NIJ09278.1 multidrug efflux system outer membrane protein [Sphingomonas vulcanisoli]